MPSSLRQIAEALSRLPPVLLLLGALFLFGLLVGTTATRSRTRRRIARQRRKGRTGARDALRLLRRRGYHVLETEVLGNGRFILDGEMTDYQVRADAVVRRWWRRYVVEFKGGEASASPKNRHTRRQLLEYAHVFGVRGVLLVDAPAGEVHLVEFPPRRRGTGRPNGG